MAEISFEVKQDALTVIKNTTIEANFEEMRKALNEMIEPYRNLVVTSDGIAAAKSDRAKIRNIAKNIDQYKATVKKEFNKPVVEFEKKCKELIAICTDAADHLDIQIKGFEEREAAEKFARLRQFYDDAEYVTEKEFCPWEAVKNDRWGNKTYSEDEAKGEIANALLKTREDIDTIRSLDEADRPYLLDFYKSCRDIGQVIRKSNELKLRRIEEQRRAEEARARQEAENARRAKEVIAEARKPSEYPAAEETAQTPERQREPVRVLDFRCWVTEQQALELKGFFRSRGIKFGPVE